MEVLYLLWTVKDDLCLCSFLAAIIYATIWYVRYRYGHVEAKNDLVWFIAFWALSIGLGLSRRWGLFVWTFDFYTWPRMYSERQQRKIDAENNVLKIAKGQIIPELDLSSNGFSDYTKKFLMPVIFPCRTSHTRLFPKKHSFSYSYFMVGIPVGWRGSTGSLLSADLKTLPWTDQQPQRSWFNVDSADYLARGDSVHGLQGKLDAYLESQNVKPEDYRYAYLVTAPKFMGYSFNPVSFWYLYDGQKQLKAMILEVNNTFDERRMYFLKDLSSDVSASPKEDADTVHSQAGLADHDHLKSSQCSEKTNSSKFAAAWSKDFHVSPFNSRKGGYSLSATNPFYGFLNRQDAAKSAVIDNIITLSSSKGHPKLVARIFSSGEAIHPHTVNDTVSEWQVLKFVLSWSWVGFATFPRIVLEAAKLFFRRKLHVWYRPEVLRDSIGRNETGEEKAIAHFFRDYLKLLVDNSNLPVPLQFVSGIATLPSAETFTPRCVSLDTKAPCILKITTPLFYAQLARQSNIQKFFESCISESDPQRRIMHVSSPDLLLQLFESSDTHHNPSSSRHFSTIDRCRWRVIRLLRRIPSQSPIPSLDSFALNRFHIDRPGVEAYRKALLKLLASDYLAFGIPGLIDAVFWLASIWLCWTSVQNFESLVKLISHDKHWTFFQFTEMVLACTGIHIWRGLGKLP